MNPAHAPQRTAVGAASLAIALVSAGWIVHLRAGRPLGWVAGAMVGVIPLALIILTLLWLAVRAIGGRWIAWRAATVVAASSLLTLAVVVVYCGPVACFTMGRERAMGWFVVVGVALAAFVHHVALERTGRKARNG